MERDQRLTGSLHGQIARAEAPSGFEVNNPWKVSLVECSKVQRRETNTLFSWKNDMYNLARQREKILARRVEWSIVHMAVRRESRLIDFAYAQG